MENKTSNHDESKALHKADVSGSAAKLDELKKAAEPLIKYLCENHHPHVTAIVTGTSVELLEGLMSIPKIFDYVVD